MMLQYLHINNSLTIDFSIKYDPFKSRISYYIRYLLITLFFLYATSFLAVSTPFLPKNTSIIYYTGCALIVFRLISMIVFTYYEIRYSALQLIINNQKLCLRGKKEYITILFEDILFIKRGLFNNLTIITGTKRYTIPLHLLSEDDRHGLLSFFVDIVPSRTEIIQKVKEVSESVLLALLLAVHIIQYIAQNYYIPTGSMNNTLMEGDHLFAEKITYGLRVPAMGLLKKELHFGVLQIRKVSRGDIVIFKPPIGNSKVEYIKRIIAVEGDLLEIKEGSVFLNNEITSEPYVIGSTLYHGENDYSIDGIVPKGMVVVLGDNRIDSHDSRFFGYVPIENIRAKAFFLYFNYHDFINGNFSRFGMIK